jgi:ribosomal protein S18 acetylase RimI-like enzyme
MTEVVAHPSDGEEATWEVRRDGRPLGAALTRIRRGGVLLSRLDVSEADAGVALDALLEALRERGQPSLAVDVVTGDRVLAAALDGRDARLEATQMVLDLSSPVAPPARVTLRAMTREEFARYRDQLITAYAQDMLDAGSFTDRDVAHAASVRSTEELLPDGVDSPGQHLWTAYDDKAPVGILWIFVAGPRGYIYDIEVHESQRRRGYGREILDAGARAARDLGAGELGLNVFGHNDGARAMYEKAGYATTERTYRIALDVRS